MAGIARAELIQCQESGASFGSPTCVKAPKDLGYPPLSSLAVRTEQGDETGTRAAEHGLAPIWECGAC